VRLRDIDAPEICQAWGEEARRALVELVIDKPATLYAGGPDKHGRTLGVVWVGGVNVGQRLVEEGHAWSIRSRWDRGPLVKQEKMARALGRGLHADGAAQWPQDFRRAHGRCSAAGVAPAASAARR
jgi:endonuclease YncB( thermonuclease family)